MLYTIIAIALFAGLIGFFALSYKGYMKKDHITDEEGKKLIDKMINLKSKKERIEKLMEIANPANDNADIIEIIEKQKNIIAFINEYYYKYGALLLRYYATKYVDEMKHRYSEKTADVLILIKEMQGKINELYMKISDEYSLNGNKYINDEMQLIMSNIQETINSIVLFETNKIIASLSPIDEKNEILKIVDSYSINLSYDSMKTNLDREYDRFIAEHETR